MTLSRMHARRRWLPILTFVGALGCGESASRLEQSALRGSARLDSSITLAKTLDLLIDTTKAYEFDFPLQSTEGGRGLLHRLADSSTRIDIDRFGETGRSRERFYMDWLDLHLAVSVEERYDRPMSGHVVRATVDSTWFEHDTAIKWIDSLGVVRAGSDSLLLEHGEQVRAEFLWALHMAGTVPTWQESGRKSHNER